MTTPGRGQYADVNGISLYYEIHGTGQPLVLLHGGLMSGETFGPVLPALAENTGHSPGSARSRPHGGHRPAARRAPDG
jgi:pimeloyl-ACP methyl ester carboxylesterase